MYNSSVETIIIVSPYTCLETIHHCISTTHYHCAVRLKIDSGARNLTKMNGNL